jgi:predicted RNase H-like nuclease (RuvC/YqgF family)
MMTLTNFRSKRCRFFVETTDNKSSDHKKMSVDANANGDNKVRNLRQLFEESATQEIRATQELDKNISEISEYIDQVQRFCIKKSSEIKNLRQNISDTDTGRVTSGYSVAKDMIQQLEKKVAEKSKDVMRLKNDVAQKDLQLSKAEKSVEENNVRIQELNIDIDKKQRLIEELNRQIIEMKQILENENRSTENPREPVKECKDEIISCLKDTSNEERNAEIEKMRSTIAELQKNLTEKENQHRIERRLCNFMKIRQLEPLAKKSVDMEELLIKIRQETAFIAERVTVGNTCQPIKSTAVAANSSDRPLTGQLNFSMIIML